MTLLALQDMDRRGAGELQATITQWQSIRPRHGALDAISSQMRVAASPTPTGAASPVRHGGLTAAFVPKSPASYQACVDRKETPGGGTVPPQADRRADAIAPASSPAAEPSSLSATTSVVRNMPAIDAALQRKNGDMFRVVRRQYMRSHSPVAAFQRPGSMCDVRLTTYLNPRSQRSNQRGG